jgi:hypothetical protein
MLSSSRLPKFIHYAGHAETLSDIFEGLGLHTIQRKYPASAFFVEYLLQKDGTLAVRMFIKDGDTGNETISRFPGQTDDTIPISQFSDYLSKRLDMAGFNDLLAQCNNLDFKA